MRHPRSPGRSTPPRVRMMPARFAPRAVLLLFHVPPAWGALKNPPKRVFSCSDRLPVRVIALGVAGVQLTRTTGLVRVADHLVPVCDPAWGAAGGVVHGVQMRGEAERRGEK